MPTHTNQDLDQIRAATDLADIVGRYVDLRRAGREHEGCCPFHADKTPSFTLFTGRDGIQRFHCHGCGERGDVLDFLVKIESITLPEAARRLGAAELPSAAARPFRPVIADNMDDDWRPILPVPEDAPAFDPAAVFNPKRDRVTRLRPVRTDAYRAADGQLLGYVLRCQFEDGGKWTPTVTFCEGPNGERRWAMRPFPIQPYGRPLQGLDDLAGRPAAPVLVVEGEKAAAAARQALPGFVVVTWPGGTNGAAKADWRPLQGRAVTLWPDADEPGVEVMRTIAGLLDFPEGLRIIDVTGLEKGLDVADLVEQGMAPAEIVAWAKQRVRAYAAPPEPPQTPDPSPRKGRAEKRAPAANGAADQSEGGGAGSGKRADQGSVAAPGPGRSRPEPAAENRGTTGESGATGPERPEPPPAAGELVGLPRQPSSSAYASLTTWSNLDLALSDKGVPHPNLDNACRLLERHPDVAGRFWYDDFLQRILSDWNAAGEPAEWSDADDVRLALWAQRTMGIGRMAVGTVRDAVTAVAMAHRRNEALEWLNALAWDGVPRLHLLLPLGFGTESNVYTEAVGRCWLISMVARVCDPGCKVDTMPVFEGAQGRGKSTALQVLVGARWFAEAAESVLSKDFFQALQGKLLVEIGEMDAFTRGEVTAVKRVITCRVDRYRAPYGRRTEDHPRQCVFAGTTNKDDWNRDETGARRFWPVTTGQVDLAWLARWREALFAEAVALYRQGQDWWRIPDEDAKREQEARRSGDAWEPLIEDYLRGEMETTVGVVLEKAVGVPPERWDRAIQMRAATCLRVLGWSKLDAWRGGKAVKLWVRGEGSKGSNATLL